jgi:hypothetical protein
LQAHGHAGEAGRYFQAAEEWLRGRLAIAPDHDDHREWLVSALMGQQKWDEATRMVAARLVEEPDHVTVRGLAAVLAARRGDTAVVARHLHQQQPWERGPMLLFRARVAAIEGQHDQAVALLSEAVAAGVGSWHWVHGTAWHDFELIRSDVRFRRLMNMS